MQNKPRKKRTTPQDAAEGLDTTANVKLNDRMIPGKKSAVLKTFQINISFIVLRNFLKLAMALK